jgi:hypothetical protein
MDSILNQLCLIRRYTKCLQYNLKGRCHFEDLDADGSTYNTEMKLKKREQEGVYWINLA